MAEEENVKVNIYGGGIRNIKKCENNISLVHWTLKLGKCNKIVTSRTSEAQ